MLSSITRALLQVALLVATLATVGADSVCHHGVDSPSCQNLGPSGVLASDHVLLQRAYEWALKRSNISNDPTDMVNDENGFQGGDENYRNVDTNCAEANVRRRRRAESMCACRRRSSGMRSDQGWICQNDLMVQEAPKYTNPVWSEEFDDELGDGTLNESRWVLTYSDSGNGNNEEQFYTTRSDNLHIEDGVLKITGKRESFGTKSFTSGKITTKDKGYWGPGTRIEVRAKLPLGQGTWPAIWMMPMDSNYGGWPDSGEIDIMEAVGKNHGKVFGTIHTGAYNHMLGTHQGQSFYTDYSEWHTYALEWEDDKLTWYADGNLYNTFAPDDTNDYAKWPFNRRFYLILNLALGGNLGGPIGFSDDQIMEVDYVRVFCLDGSMSCATDRITCCDSCPGRNYCSQISLNCYDEQNKDYYDSCNALAA